MEPKKRLIYRTEDTGIGARDIIVNALMSTNGPKKTGHDYIMIACPFHDDNTPSCGIFTSIGMQIPLGFFNCLGCGERGPWNKLAQHMGLPQVKEWQAIETKATNTQINEDKLLGHGYTLNDVLKTIGSPQSLPWPENRRWKNYSGSIIRQLGGLYIVDRRTDELILFFPIRVGQRYYGGVRAYIEPVNGLKYLTTQGDWVKEYGLLGLDYATPLIKKYRAVVLVEGVRDVLRLLQEGIPSVAILGTNNFSRKKAMSILSIADIKTVYCLPDNDNAGTKMARDVRTIITSMGLCKYQHLKLPKELDDTGKLIKMDPDNAPRHIIKHIKELVNGH